MMRVVAGVIVVIAASVAFAQEDTPYTHDKTGVVFRAPQTWKYIQTVHLLDGGDQIQWVVPAVDTTVYAWIIDEENDAAAIERRLDAAVDAKIAQRRSANYRNYDIRRDTVRRLTINGHPALTAVAQFDVGRDQHAVESVAWVMSPKAHVFLFAPAKSESANATLQPEFDRLLASIRFP